MTTRFIEKNFADPLKTPEISVAEKEFALQAWKQMIPKTVESGLSSFNSPWQSYWRGV
jgi:hypothetical protein